MASGGEIEVLLRLKDELSGTLKRVNGKLGNFDRQVKTSTKNTQGFTKSMKGAKVAVGAFVGAAVTRQIVKVGTELFNLGLESERIGASFRNLSDDISGTYLDALKEASAGTVSELSLMKSANQALLLGIQKETIPELLKVSRALGKATGRTAEEAFADIATGIGRQSRLILDNLGIIVDTTKAYDDYARAIGTSASNLTELQKKQAFTNAALDQAKIKAAQVGENLDDMSTKVAQVTAKWEDFRVEIGKALVEGLGEALKENTEFFSSFRKGSDEASESVIGFTDVLSAFITESLKIKRIFGAGPGFITGITGALIGKAEEKKLDKLIKPIAAAQKKAEDALLKFERDNKISVADTSRFLVQTMAPVNIGLDLGNEIIVETEFILNSINDLEVRRAELLEDMPPELEKQRLIDKQIKGIDEKIKELIERFPEESRKWAKEQQENLRIAAEITDETRDTFALAQAISNIEQRKIRRRKARARERTKERGPLPGTIDPKTGIFKVAGDFKTFRGTKAADTRPTGAFIGAAAGIVERQQQLAHGGIVTRPTNALIGEAGPEAVIPLDKMRGGTNFTININAEVLSERVFEQIGEWMERQVNNRVAFGGL